MNKRGIQLSGFVQMILLVSLVMTIFFITVADFEENYIETNITDQKKANLSIGKEIDKSKEINKTYGDIFNAFKALGQSGEDKGVIETLGDGAIALPKAILALPAAIFTSMGLALSQFMAFATALKIPREIIVIGVVSLSSFVLFLVVTLWRRFPA